MTGDPRPIRDALGEALWLAPGFKRHPWAYWETVAPDETETKRREGDAVLRHLEALGFTVVRIGDPKPVPALTSPVIYRDRVGGGERLIRRSKGDDWQIVTVTEGAETIDQAFTVNQALLNGGLVLAGSQKAKQIPGLGSQLAALNEIYRLAAQDMEPAT